MTRDDPDRQAWIEATKRMLAALDTVDEAAADRRGVAGTATCPICGAVLRWRVAENGHRAGRCATDGCVAFME
ncbi:MAG: hypothetical protein HQL39_16880 [Alphaproteobacteria bacterium]|nr:hypothetical protein [Alphaproteobacteria bacterium]